MSWILQINFTNEPCRVIALTAFQFLYSTFNFIKSKIWTDYFQAFTLILLSWCNKVYFVSSHSPKTLAWYPFPWSVLEFSCLMLRGSVISLPAGSISECIISKHLGAIFVFIFQNSCWISPIFTGWRFFDNLIEITYCMYIINYSIKSFDLAGQVQSHQYPKLQKAFS